MFDVLGREAAQGHEIAPEPLSGASGGLVRHKQDRGTCSGVILREGRLSAKLTGKRAISTAAKHNLREPQRERGAREHIDPRKSHLNEVLWGPETAQGIDDYAADLMARAGVKTRKNSTLAIEAIVSLSEGSGIAEKDFFEACVLWAADHYGAPVLSAVWHRDESHPHVHVLILPVIGNRLNADVILGNRATLKQRRESFNSIVCKPFGVELTSGRAIKKHDRQVTALKICEALASNPRHLNNPLIKNQIVRALSAADIDLMALIHEAGLSLPETPPEAAKPIDHMRAFVSQMIKPQKMEKNPYRAFH